MSGMNSKVATVVLAIAAVAVVLAFLLMPGPEPAAPPAADKLKSAAGSPMARPANPDRLTESSLGEGPRSVPTVAASTTDASTGSMAWEDRLDELLTNEADNATTVRGLVSSMRGLPPEAQEEFAAHAVNLCEDEQFGQLEAVYYNSATPTEVSEIIFNDALNRPDEIKLPMLAKTLRNPVHPMAGEAREILEMYLDLEPGSVPQNGWEQAVNQYIREQGAP